MANPSTGNPAEDSGENAANPRTAGSGPNGDEAVSGDGAGSELPTRRERLEALKARRVNPAAAGGNPGRSFAGAKRGQGLGAGLLGAAGTAQGRQRRQMMMKIYAMLTQTPEEGTGMVPGTPFSETGVAKLMSILRGRAAQENVPGAKVAAGMLKFLAPQDPGAEAIGGASVEKLQMVARAAKRFRGQGPK